VYWEGNVLLYIPPISLYREEGNFSRNQLDSNKLDDS
jgi:hypothetical protein